jgi:hypothetical protein
MNIISARITEMPKSFFDPMPVVYATTADGVEHRLFDYFPDEISFSPAEFVGLTLEQARQLKFEKDKRYLQS